MPPAGAARSGASWKHPNQRGARSVAPEQPTGQERSQSYFQRHVAHPPSAGEIVFFDRSWYDRAGVERVMGFCTPAECREFMRQTPELERMLTHTGPRLHKHWFGGTRAEHVRRFTARETDPTKQWTLSPIDKASLDEWGGRHRGEGGDGLLHRHGRRAVDDREVEREAAGAHRGDAPSPPHPAL